ncbi:hypothetical protein [Streptomyces lonarensis]|uniref:Uncharacterized protein n=1 Tax=Streptomyces lonarensis TaxID=700599 RepID=A0A7X6HYS5_9ACTN|nr:hypothetical protein [Streptomyces lonarensis]NJQ05519.1 hypothetical protein [Streptomyces lonarensis]
MPRRVFEEVGPFDPTLRDSEDVEYSERLSAGYDIRLTDRVVAAHDEEHRLGRMLREQFRRAQYLLPFAAAHRRRPGALRANSALGVASASLAVASLPAVVLHPALALVPAAGAAVFAVADPGLVGFVRRKRGLRFVPLFVALHLLVNVQIGLGAAYGWLRSRVDPRFGARAATDHGAPRARGSAEHPGTSPV